MTDNMKVLVACEYSGIVRDAFIRKGHDAVSCDILPTESDGPHYEGDVTDLLKDKWDLVVAHPPCTFLANSGARWLHSQEGRWESMKEGIEFFKKMLEANSDKIAVENPIPHKYAVEGIGRKYDQKIQPWQFGHLESKAVCLWLKNLPKLEATNNVYDEMMKLPVKVRNKVHWMGGNKGKERSKFFEGIAEAMADQWG